MTKELASYVPEISDTYQESHSVFPRRKFLYLLTIGGSGSLLAACTQPVPPTVVPKEAPPRAIPTPDPNLLRAVGDTLEDQTLGIQGDRGLKRVIFRFDPAYAKGSLAMEVCFEGNGKFRVMSKELNPRPGWLVDKVYDYASNCLTKHPVIELAFGDIEEVYLGIGGSEPQTYQDMRVYEIVRDRRLGLDGRFLGLRTVDPKTIQLRDTPKP